MGKIDEFVNIHGNGKNKINETNKKNRIEKIMGKNEFKKLKLSGNDKGFELKHFDSPNWETGNDPMEELKGKMNDLPNDVRGKNHKVLNIQINDDGSGSIEGIVLNGKENDPKIRSLYSISFLSDEKLAIFEKDLYLEGKLKEVSNRTMSIHQSNGDLKTFEDDPNINTGDDEEGDI